MSKVGCDVVENGLIGNFNICLVCDRDDYDVVWGGVVCDNLLGWLR